MEDNSRDYTIKDMTFDFSSLSTELLPMQGQVPMIDLTPLEQQTDQMRAREQDLFGSKLPHSIGRRTRELKRRLGILRKLRDEHGGRRLRLAARTNNVELIERLLKIRVNPNLTDEKKRSALHIAASIGNVEIVELLLRAGADPNLKDLIGNTPLHLAACINHVSVVTVLLKAGTDLKALDNLGRTPLQVAQSKLKLLQMDTLYTSDKMKAEAQQVIEMMRAYLDRSGQVQEAQLLEAFTSRLQLSQNKEEVDANIHDLLGSLTQLTLR